MEPKNSMVTAREAKTSELPAVVDLYKRMRYSGTIAAGDHVLVAVANEQVVGAVRLCKEFGTSVLRGMYILNDYQRQGVGTILLRESEKHLADGSCYCIPYRHLESFYGQCAFETIDVAKAPQGLIERLEQYKAKGFDVILMKRSGRK
jgi:GNAT superfamily N-acetyltransferase